MDGDDAPVREGRCVVEEQVVHNHFDQVGRLLLFLFLKELVASFNEVIIDERVLDIFVVPQVPKQRLYHSFTIRLKLDIWLVLEDAHFWLDNAAPLYLQVVELGAEKRLLFFIGGFHALLHCFDGLVNLHE